MLWLLYTSFKSTDEVYKDTWSLPHKLHVENYKKAWVKANIGRYFFNSVFVTVVSITLILIVSAMAAYVLARFTFKWNRFIFYTFLSGLMLPAQLVIVPLFFLLKDLRMLDSYAGLILVYVAFSLPFSIFVLTGFFKTLPSELRDAAVIDGCSENGTFWRVMLPLAKPGLITIAIFNFLSIWNEYFFALVFISNPKLRTLPLGLANLTMVMRYQADLGALFASLVIVMIPTLLVYIVLQDRLTKGITMGALKG
jgi:ABC-type glycerol-3-phosphate transport system permease component